MLTQKGEPDPRAALSHAIGLARAKFGPRAAAHLLYLQARELTDEADREWQDEDVLRKKRAGSGRG
jgi:hypothetical protein